MRRCQHLMSGGGVLQRIVLGIGYCENEDAFVRREWRNHDVDCVFVNTMEEAVIWRSKKHSYALRFV